MHKASTKTGLSDFMANQVATSHSVRPLPQAGIEHIQGKDQLKPITDVEKQSK